MTKKCEICGRECERVALMTGGPNLGERVWCTDCNGEPGEGRPAAAVRPRGRPAPVPCLDSDNCNGPSENARFIGEKRHSGGILWWAPWGTWIQNTRTGRSVDVGRKVGYGQAREFALEKGLHFRQVGKSVIWGKAP